MPKFYQGWRENRKDRPPNEMTGAELLWKMRMPNMMIISLPGTHAKLVVYKYADNNDVYLMELTTTKRKILGIKVTDQQVSDIYASICNRTEPFLF